jgi:nucleoside-diphosphate-sugar epimerase
MRIAVTGAGGFIGRATRAALQAAHIDLVAHLGPASDAAASRHDAGRCFDIADRAALLEFVAECDTVVHLAGPPSVAQSFADPISCVRAHVVGTATLLDVMREARIQNIVYLSSAEVYGSVARGVVNESYPPAPRSPYAAAKAAAEYLVRAQAAAGAARGYIIRAFSVYGPGMSPLGLIPTVLAQSRNGLEIVVNDLSPIRDYCFVEDLTELIVRAVRAPRSDLVILNAAYGKGYSVAETIKVIGDALHVQLVGRERGPQRPAESEITRLIGDVEAARRELGWRARHDLIEGIRRTLPAPVAR